MPGIEKLLIEVSAIRQRYEHIAKVTGENFNVFKIVKIAEDEVKHSAFLAELLNPKGSHGQGAKFLKLFVDQLNVSDFNCETAIVEAEKYIGPVTETTGGQIDIFIEDRMSNCITIENKIYASDQENQLIRYHNYGKHNFKKQSLFYLTLKGSDASPISVENKQLRIKLDVNKDYELKSYKTEILPWLEKCQREAVSMPLLREGIAHYINIIKHLTGESTNKAMSKDIIGILTNSPVNLRTTKLLSDHFFQAKAKILWNFWVALEEELKINKIEFEKITETVNEEKTLNCFKSNFNERSIFFGLYSKEVYREGDIVIRWGCELGLNINVGFIIWEKGKKGIAVNSNFTKSTQITKLIYDCDGKYKSHKHFLGIQYTEPQLNFDEFNSEAIFNLADKDKLKQTVQKIAEKAKKDIQFFEENLKRYIATDISNY